MMPLLCLVFLGGTIAMGDDKDKVEKQPVPASPVGSWEVPGRRSGSGVTLSPSVVFRDGKMVLIEPRDKYETGKQPGCRIEAEYAITKSGRVYGCITSVFGGTNVREGETFSFIPTLEEGNLVVQEPKGDNLGGLIHDGAAWKPKP